MGSTGSQITSLTIVYSSVYSGADQRNFQSSASLAFVRGIHRRPVNSPHKGSITRKMFPFDDAIMNIQTCRVPLLWITTSISMCLNDGHAFFSVCLWHCYHQLIYYGYLMKLTLRWTPSINVTRYQRCNWNVSIDPTVQTTFHLPSKQLKSYSLPICKESTC